MGNSEQCQEKSKFDKRKEEGSMGNGNKPTCDQRVR